MAPTSNFSKVSCLQPVKLVNRHYRKIEPDKDKCFAKYRHKPDYEVSVPCGKCFLCKRKYQANWRIRLNHEFMYGNHDISRSWFCTFTVAEPYYMKALYEPSKMIRSFTERYRELTRQVFGRSNGKSITHWIISERGEKRGRLHFHGILFDSLLPKYIVESCWKYGFVSFKKLTIKRCGYVTKYITKGMSPTACKESIEHQPRVWCSPGIGKCYTELPQARQLATGSGFLVPFLKKDNFVYAMPRYYKNKLFTEEQLEILKFQNISQLALLSTSLPEPPFSYANLSFDSIDSLLYAVDSDKSNFIIPIFNSVSMSSNDDFDNQYEIKYRKIK